MDKQKEKKVSAKLPQLINKNKNLAALVSKLRKEDSTKDDKNTGNSRAINTNNLPAISESIKDKILNNETIVKLFPDIELSIQILTSSILAPNDMGSTNLIYLNNDTKIPTEIKIGILDTIKTYISTNYKLEDKLSTIVREAMFTKGAYVEAIIPEAAIDAMINENSTEVSIESFVEKNSNEKKISILGIEDNNLKYSLEDMEISLEKKDSIKKEVDLTLKISEEETDRIIGLGMGADDYMVKPFSVRELAARVKAQLRRYINYNGKKEENSILQYDELKLDTLNYKIYKLDEEVNLTKKEFEILKLFLSNPNRVFTKAQIFNNVWENEYLNDDNTVMVHIKRLRNKIENNPNEPKYIVTVWGIGYKLGE